jgi:hypothetical protein
MDNTNLRESALLEKYNFARCHICGMAYSKSVCFSLIVNDLKIYICPDCKLANNFTNDKEKLFNE